MRRRFAICLLTLSTAALIATSRPAAHAEPGESASPGLPQPIVDTHDLMDLFNRPLYKQLKAEMQASADQKNWQAISDRGWQTAEVANLVAMRRDQPQWRQLAADLQDAGMRLGKAARAEDEAQTTEAYRAVIERCNACHQTVAPARAPTLEP